MLVLSRTPGEEIDVIDTQTGERILVITCVEVRGNKTRLGFSASPRYQIIRDELRPDSPDPQPVNQAELSPVS